MIDKISNDPEIWCINIELPNSPLKNLNSYVVKTKDGNLVIDTGYNRKECKEALFSSLQKLNVDLSKTSLFLTHFHSDHMGLAHEFVEKGSKVYMGRIDYEYFCRLKNNEAGFALSEIYLEEGFPKELLDLQSKLNDGRRFGTEKIFPVVCVEQGTEIILDDVRFICIHTPGHTPGHMMLYMPDQQVLFTGDHILFDITPNINIGKNVKDSLGDYINSLKKTKEISAEIVLPAHRSKQIGLEERTDQILYHHEQRLIEIIHVIKENPDITAYEIAGKIKWSMKGKTWNEAPADQKWFAMGETLAHVYHLVIIGKVKRRKIRDKVVYSLF